MSIPLSHTSGTLKVNKRNIDAEVSQNYVPNEKGT